jgi:putative transposase
LPHAFPPWKSVHHYLRTWRKDGTWERVHAALRERLRVRMKRDPQLSAGVVDSQSVKSTGVGGRRARLRRRQKGQGHSKRHLLVDTEGFVLKARVHSAKVMDYEGIKAFLERADEAFPRLRHVWLDAGYREEGKGADRVEKSLGWSAKLVERPPNPTPTEVL